MNRKERPVEPAFPLPAFPRSKRASATMKVAVRFLLGVLVMGIASSLARADGMFFYSMMSSNDPVEATKQRAVLWQRDQIWEVHIEPVFHRGSGSGVWVVPFPVEPQVSESSHAFFQELEMLTAPVFVSFCREPDCSGGGGGGGGTGTGAQISEAHSTAEVWQQGTVGDLDFTVLSAGDGDDLMDWLSSHGYEAPSNAEALVTSYQNEGAYFFVGRLDNTLDPATPLTPVRFQLPGLYPPSFPLRMTSLGVSNDSYVDLTFWILFDRQEAFVLGSHDYASFADRPTTPDELYDARDLFFEEQPNRLLLSLATSLGSDDRYRHLDEFALYHNTFGAIPLAELGLTPPAAWSPEIQKIREDESWVFRYRARLDPAGLEQDLRFSSTPAGDLPSHDNFYVNHEGDCFECADDKVLSGCTVSPPHSGSTPAPVSLLFAVGLFFVCALSKRRKTG